MRYMRNMRRLWLAALLLTLLLSGCAVSGNASVDELLRAPQQAGTYGAAQSALNSYLGESAQLRYPLQGEFLSPFLTLDWDGDGGEELAILYQTGGSANVCMALLKQAEDGSWLVSGTVEGLSDTVQSVSFACMQQGKASQIVVGYASQGEQYLAVYACENGTVQALLQQTYTQYLVADITGSGVEDLVLLASDGATGKLQIQLLTAGPDGFAAVQAPGLSAEKFAGCASISAGKGADGLPYLILDGWTGATGNYLASVILRYNGETASLEEAKLVSTSDLYTASQRYVTLLTSRDLDGDGIVEIPTQPETAGVLNLSQDKRLDFVVWMDFTSHWPEKSFGLLDEQYGYYLALPSAWQGNLLLTDGKEKGTVELRSLSGETSYLSLRVVDPSEKADGWRRLGMVASMQIQIKLGEGATDVSVYQLASSIYLL